MTKTTMKTVSKPFGRGYPSFIDWKKAHVKDAGKPYYERIIKGHTLYPDATLSQIREHAKLKKGEILAKALQDPGSISELPVRITIGSTWILDEAATKAFKLSNQHELYNTRIIYA